MNKSINKRRIITSVAIAALIIALLGLGAYLIEKHDLLDEQFGDTGEWGDEYDDVVMTLDDKDYVTHDRVKAYLIAGTDGGGVDKGEGLNGELADYITLLVIDDTTKKYAFYPINRNSMVEVFVMNDEGEYDDVATQQICTAHWYGRTPEERNENLQNATSDLLGGFFPESYYVVNMDDIGKVNDAIGGVTVDIKTDMTKVDPAFKKGAKVHLQGDQAESYLRARMDVGKGTNAERMERQEQYMQNAYTMVTSQLRENPEYINDLYDQLKDVVESNTEGRELSKITNKIVNYENCGFINFTGKTEVNDTIGEGKEHEEFYTDKASILDGLKKVMNIEEYVEPDDEGEGDYYS